MPPTARRCPLPPAVALALAVLIGPAAAASLTRAGAQRAQGLGGGPRPIAGRVVDGDGQPAAGAKVFLRWRAHPELPGLCGHTLGEHGIEERELGVSERGVFRVVPPNDGPFLLVAHRAEQSSSQAFPVMPGGFLTLALEPTFFFAGTVVDDAGQPVAGATVELSPTAQMRTRIGLYRVPERWARAETGADGRFRLPFEHGYLRGARWGVLMGVFAHEGDLAVPTLEIQRPTDGARDLTVKLAKGRTIRGVVTDGRRPLAGVRVSDPSRIGGATSTDAAGEFEITPPGGALVLWVAGRGAVLTPDLPRGARVTLTLPEGMPFRARLPARLAGARVLFAQLCGDDLAPIEWVEAVGEDGAVESRLSETPRMTLAFVEVDGRFVQLYQGQPTRPGIDLGEVKLPRARGLAGQVLGPDGVPVPGARLALGRTGDRVVPPRIGYTDRGGRFRFADVFGERLSIAAEAGALGQIGLPVPEPLPASPLVLSLPGGASVRGVVVTADGEPAAGGWVAIYRSIGANEIRVPALRMSMTSLCTHCDERGRFRFDGLQAGVGWSVVAGDIRSGAHCNALDTVQSGGPEIRLQTAVSQR